MATTKIPIVCGSRPSKSVPKHSRSRRRNTEFSRKSFDKIQGFVRYQFEMGPFDDCPDSDEERCLRYDVTDQGQQESDDQVTFPIELGGAPSGFKSRFSSSVRWRGGANVGFKESGISHNFADYVNTRSLGFGKAQYAYVDNEYGTHQMIENSLFREKLIKLKDVNKIFCSQWLNSDQILLGTKCNQLLLYNINSKKVDLIPCLKGNTQDPVATNSSGIHALELNPSKTMLATGGQNSNEMAIYQLPTLDPVCTAENAHSDLVFDLCWLDDQFFVSASRDKSLAMWKVNETMKDSFEPPAYGQIDPIVRKKCFGADKVRALLFNPNYMEIVALSLNAKIHVWDATRFTQVMSQELQLTNENVCMAQTENSSMYGIGSKSHVTLIDPRTLQSISMIDTRKSGPSIRSISFRGSTLTIGTGSGEVLFYDVKAGRYLEGSEGMSELRSSKCHVTVEDMLACLNLPDDSVSDSAIYTHCYDWSGTRLFTAGGPLSAGFRGCYASLWC